MTGAIETKSAAGVSATLVITQAVALVFALWPAAASAVSPDQQLQIASFAATVFTAAAVWFAPHTHRPDLAPVEPPP